MSAHISFSTIVGMGGCGGPPDDKRSMRLVLVMIVVCVPVALISSQLLILEVISLKTFLFFMLPCLAWSGGLAVYLSFKYLK